MVGVIIGAAAFIVVAMLACSLSASQLLARRPVPTVTPSRTARPTWTVASVGMVVGLSTLDATRFPPSVTPGPPATPQVLVAGSAQGIVVPQGEGIQGVQTVVVILVTATPPPLGPTNTPGPTSTPGPPTATPTATYTPPPPVVVHVKVDQANVRQGPANTFPAVTKLDKDTTVTVVGRNREGDWWKICCVNNRDVWIADSVVTVEGPIWTVAEAVDIPPSPLPPPTAAPSLTPSLTPTYAWQFRIEKQQPYPLNQNFFKVDAIIYNGYTPLWGYKLKIRKLSTGQEWLSNGSEAYWSDEQVEWKGNLTPTPIPLKWNVSWDSNSVQAALGDDVWEVTATDGAGNPLSAPVRVNTSIANSQWYYLVFTSR